MAAELFVPQLGRVTRIAMKQGRSAGKLSNATARNITIQEKSGPAHVHRTGYRNHDRGAKSL